MPPETPPWRVKNPWQTPSMAVRLEAQNILLSGVTMADGEVMVKCLRREAVTQARCW